MIPPLPLAFVGSFPDPLHHLEPPGAELVLAGRSNAGKSSLLNALAGRRKLAKVSATPGKTTLLNVYRMPAGYLLDLPGYGWARASKSDRAAYRKLVDGVIGRRPGLQGVVWLLDIRHPPSVDDREMQDLLADRERATLVVLTKADKLTQAERKRATNQRAQDLGLAVEDLIVTSSTTGLGVEDLRESILHALRVEPGSSGENRPSRVLY